MSLITKQRQRLVNFKMADVFEHYLNEKSSPQTLHQWLKNEAIEVEAVKYTDPVTGKIIFINEKNGLKLLKSRLQGDEKAANQIVFKGKLSDSK